MVTMAEIDEVEDWLIGQALLDPHVPEMFGELCDRLRACGLPLDRAVLGWATLHPLIDAETVDWEPETGYDHRLFEHYRSESESWTRSPMRAVLVNSWDILRLPLTGPDASSDYPLCEDLRARGFTDYIVIATHFSMPTLAEKHGNTGILVSWSTKNPDGFSDFQIKAIQYIQKRLAISARANLEAQITRNVAETYLGRWAGNQVLKGQIRHGDGERLKAVIYYSDMRGSTEIAERLGPDNYLKFLNDYFQATAGSVIELGGEVLDFIGDAVLGIFPIEHNDLEPAALRALQATDLMSSRIANLNVTNREAPRLTVGVALSVGDVMFGNIGIPNRLTFSVIGQTVHAAARIEALTKSVGRNVLLTEEIGYFVPNRIEPVGNFELTGFSTPRPLFALKNADQ